MITEPTDAVERRSRYDIVSGALESLTDAEISGLLAGAEAVRSGIGGIGRLVEVGGTRVFVKQLPLTAREQIGDGHRSTANLFDLPVGCHYGIASPGFGAWREVEANEAATRLVAAGTVGSFPMLYHWRILQEPLESQVLLSIADEVAGHWREDRRVEARLDAIVDAPATVLMFFEFVPVTLPEWLDQQLGMGTDAADAAIGFVEDGLLAVADELETAELLHFDAHFGNMLTDGNRLYLTDFGLANSPHFQLSNGERRFLTDNKTHDRSHMLTRLVDWIISAFIDGDDWEKRDMRIQMVQQGHRNGIEHLSQPATAVVERHAPVAAIINDFYRRLRFEDHHAQYPTEAVRRALDDRGRPRLSDQEH